MSIEGADDIARLDGLEVKVLRIPVLSTAHLSEESKALLESGQAHWLCHCAPYEFGWFVAVPTPDVAATASEPPITDDLRALFVWADKYGFSWIRLDDHGDRAAGLPLFD